MTDRDEAARAYSRSRPAGDALGGAKEAAFRAGWDAAMEKGGSVVTVTVETGDDKSTFTFRDASDGIAFAEYARLLDGWKVTDVSEFATISCAHAKELMQPPASTGEGAD